MSLCTNPYCRAPIAGSLCAKCGALSAHEAGAIGTVSKAKVTTLDAVAASAVERLVCGQFWDPVWGGGIVPTSATLIGGNPGSGKTTLLLLIASALAKLTGRYSYFLSAEQSPGEIRLTADRLKIDNQDRFVVLGTQGGGADIDDALLKEYPPAIFVVDSLSALHGKDKIGQVSTCQRFKKYSLAHKAPSMLIMHMIKSFDFAGLMTIQHDVDTIIAFDSAPERMGDGVRELMAYKNRFGASHQPIYLRMVETGLAPFDAEAAKAERKRARLEQRKLEAALDDVDDLDDEDAEAPPYDEPPRLRAVPKPAPSEIMHGGQRLVRRTKKPKGET